MTFTPPLALITVKEEKERVKKYLGLVLDHQLQFVEHIDYIKKKISKRIGEMYKSKNLIPLKYRKIYSIELLIVILSYSSKTQYKKCIIIIIITFYKSALQYHIIPKIYNIRSCISYLT